MLNNVVLVGRLIEKPKVEELEGNKVSKITLAVSRSFKNENGEYETDFIDIILWNMVAENTSEYCNKGDIIGVKGRIQTKEVDGKNEIEIIADKVTFLTSRKNDD